MHQLRSGPPGGPGHAAGSLHVHFPHRLGMPPADVDHRRGVHHQPAALHGPLEAHLVGELPLVDLHRQFVERAVDPPVALRPRPDVDRRRLPAVNEQADEIVAHQTGGAGHQGCRGGCFGHRLHRWNVLGARLPPGLVDPSTEPAGDCSAAVAAGRAVAGRAVDGRKGSRRRLTRPRDGGVFGCGGRWWSGAVMRPLSDRKSR